MTGSATTGTEYMLTEDDTPAAGASLADDVIELQLPTAGAATGPWTAPQPGSTTAFRVSARDAAA